MRPVTKTIIRARVRMMERATEEAKVIIQPRRNLLHREPQGGGHPLLGLLQHGVGGLREDALPDRLLDVLQFRLAAPGRSDL